MTDKKDNHASPEEIDSGLACLVLLARYHGVAADQEGVRHKFAPPGDFAQEVDILRAAKALNLKAKPVVRDCSKLKSIPYPAMVQLKSGNWVIIGGATPETVLLQRPDGRQVTKPNLDQFERMWTGKVVLVSKKGFVPESVRKFNLSWFIPAMLKYKKLLGEVLLLSFWGCTR